MTEQPFVSVVVPHFSDLTSLDICLAALKRQSYPKDRYEIVVADNASPQGEAAVIAVIAGRARLIVVPEKGAGPARNGGVTLARGEILAFTDADCQPAEDWLAAGVRALTHDDFVGGAMQVLVADPARMTGVEAFETVFAFNNAAYVDQKGFTVTANLFCPRHVFQTVGGFRTGVSEDLDWSHRARAAGFTIGYAADAVVGHPARRDWTQLKKKWLRLNAETYALYPRRISSRLAWLLRSLALPLSAAVHAPRVLASSKLTSVRQRLGALAVLLRLRLWRTWDSLGLLVRRNEA